MMLHTKYKGSRPSGSRQEAFLLLSPYNPSYVTHATPACVHFWPQGRTLNKIGGRLLDNATYQISMHVVSENIF